MAEQKKKVVLRWYTMRRVLMTGEYVGGLIAGFGFGVAVMWPGCGNSSACHGKSWALR